MRVLAFEERGRASWRDARAPQLVSGMDAIVRPLVVGRCDLDVAFMHGRLPLAAGSALGHECIGEVVEIGAAVNNVRPGDRVLVSAQICCGTCAACRRGHTGRCQSVPFGASFGMGRAGDYGGALADLMRVPFADAMLVPWPRELDAAAMIGAADMALDAWRAVAPALSQRPQASVLVVGGDASIIALYAVSLAIALGAGEVVYWDADPRRCEIARRLGAIIRASGDGAGFEVIVDGGGQATMLQAALRAAAPEAVFTSVVLYLDALTPIPLRDLYYKGITYITGRPNVRPPMEHVVGLCRSGHFRPQDVPNSVFRFEDAHEAWPSDALRVVVCREPS